MLGGHSALDPPLPIPNRTVKQSCADDSALPVCESRSPPGSPFQRPLPQTVEGVCVYPHKTSAKHLHRTTKNTAQLHARHCVCSVSWPQFSFVRAIDRRFIALWSQTHGLIRVSVWAKPSCNCRRDQVEATEGDLICLATAQGSNSAT